MICLFGMNERLGLARSAQRQHTYLPSGADGTFQRDCSEKTAEEIDAEVKKLLDRAYAEAKEILAQHRDQLEAVTNELIKRETMDGQTFRQMIGMPEDSGDQPTEPHPEALAAK